MPLYHVWFATKHRRWLLEGDVEDTVKELVGEISAEKDIDVIEYETCIDHVHILLRAADRPGLSRAMNFLKGLSAKRLFEQMPDLKSVTGTDHFWQRRYGWKAVPEQHARTLPITFGRKMSDWRSVNGRIRPAMPQPLGWGGGNSTTLNLLRPPAFR